MQPPVGTLSSFETPDALLAAVHAAFVELVSRAVAERGVCRISLSGGSTPRRLYQQLGQTALPWDRIEWYWGDERNVPPEHEESNYRMVREAMLDPAGVPASNVFPVPVDVENPAAAARGYEATLRRQFGVADASAWPRFDLVLLGMGDDAHTASLFPETDALRVEDRWFVENWVPKFDAYRLTSTAPLINAAAHVWFLITGENKREALAQVWGEQRDAERFPSQLMAPAEGELRWIVGREALPR